MYAQREQVTKQWKAQKFGAFSVNLLSNATRTRSLNEELISTANTSHSSKAAAHDYYAISSSADGILLLPINHFVNKMSQNNEKYQ